MLEQEHIQRYQEAYKKHFHNELPEEEAAKDLLQLVLLYRSLLKGASKEDSQCHSKKQNKRT